MRLLSALIAPLIIASFAHSQAPPVPPNIPFKVIPDKLSSDSGRLIKITVSADAAAGKPFWDIPPGFDVDVSDDCKKVIIVATTDVKSGDYPIKVYVCIDKQIVPGTCIVTIKGPPLPKPPETGLLADLRIAYAADGTDVANLSNLVKLFDQIQPYCDDKTITDVGTLMDTVKGASDAIFKNSPNALRKCRDRISQELAAQITDSDTTTLTPELRIKIKSVFANIDSVLKTIQMTPTAKDKK